MVRITENTLREIIRNVLTETLNEAALDREFHYTSLEKFVSIINDDEIRLSDHEYSNGQRFLSLSRARTNQHGYQYSMYTNFFNVNYVRIEFDGRMLNTLRNTKIKPLDYLRFQGEPRNGKQEHMADYASGLRYDKNQPLSMNRQFWAQSEDRMVSTLEGIKNPLRYIIRVDIMVRDKWKNDYKAFRKALRSHPQWRNIIHLHKNDRTFNMVAEDIE